VINDFYFTAGKIATPKSLAEKSRAQLFGFILPR